MNLWQRLTREGATRPRFGTERERRPAWVDRLIKIGLALSLVIVSVPLFPLQRTLDTPRFELEKVTHEQVIAPFSFDILKTDEELERERDEAVRDVAPVFNVDESKAELARSQLSRFQADIQQVAANANLSRSERMDMIARLGLNLMPVSRRVLAEPDTAVRIVGEVSAIVAKAYETGLLAESDIPHLDGRLSVGLRRGGVLTQHPSFTVYDRRRVLETATERAAEAFPGSRDAGVAMVELALHFAQANLVYDRAETAARQEEARNSVPVAVGRIEKGERIIDSNTKVTESKLRVLRSLERAQAARLSATGPAAWAGQLLGRLLLVAMLVVSFVAFLKRHRPQLYDDMNVLIFLTTVGILVLGVAALVIRFAPNASPYLIPVGLASILLTLLLDDWIAVAGTIALSILIGTVGGLGLPFVIVSLVGGIVASASVVSVRHRWEFYRAMIFMSLAYAITILAVELISSASPLKQALRDSVWGVVNAVTATTVAIVILPVLERVFGLCTDITLLELADLNRPIFRRMMLEANGTYHHTMVIGTLAEAAATSIGANPLLARVGSYYHDIGKVPKAEYFGENLKPGMKNPHEKLTPTMSCLILESHVREGIEMARELKLPRVVRDFIPEHQGTTLMSYFYHKALEMDPGVDERDYRYPGPKPQSKETAIVMLADSVEATSRSLTDPTPSRIKAVVKRIIDQRVADGQLDECNLTHQELARVRDAFIPVLVGLFHGRVQYQWQEKAKGVGGTAARNPLEKPSNR